MQKKVDAIIVGAGLSGLTLAFYLRRAGKSFVVIEEDERCGGVMKTTTKEGFTFETGPTSGSMGTPEMAELLEDLHGKCELEIANEDSKQRWIWKKGKWHALPSGLVDGISTPLFSWKDKFRILGEPFRKKGKDPHETLSHLVTRRLGKSFLDYAVNPFVSGIYAGDPGRLVTKYALPKLYNLEHHHGSFIRGSIKVAKQKTDRDRKATRKVFSIKGGIQNLIDALCDEVGHENIIFKAKDTAITPVEGGGFLVKTGSTQYTSMQLVNTTNSKALPHLYPFIDKKELDPITNLDYAKVVQVIVGYKRWNGKPLHAFGGLFPAVEQRETLGILFPSSIFSGRAPEGGALLSVFMGGIKQEEMINMSDKEVIKIALKEIEETLECKDQPDMIEVARYPIAIPQYDTTSQWREEAIKWIETIYPGLHLAGNIRDGIGMSDRVKQARQIAESIIQQDL